MTIDVAVVGAPFLDITFEGLKRLPRVGEEIVGRSLHVGPGGTGMQAIGAARLGLSTTLVAPIRRAGLGGYIREMLASEGVAICPAEEPDASKGPVALPTTALLSTPDGVAMATVLDGGEPDPAEVQAVEARAVVLSLGRLPLAPRDPLLYAVTGGLEIGHLREQALERLRSVHALVLNSAEATALTDGPTAEEAAKELSRHVDVVVVTLGAGGALGVERGTVARAPAPDVDVLDATGAGDLFVAAYVWADLRGADLEQRIAWASLYAGLSVRAPTAFAGAIDLSTLLAEGKARLLTVPPRERDD